MNARPDSIFQGDILVVGGAPAGLKAIARILNDAGYKVRTTASGRSALRQARTHVPELILLDTGLPEEDGFETYRRLQADERTRTIPVIFIGSSKNDSTKAFRTPGGDFIHRPFSAGELLARIRPYLTLEIIERRRLEENWKTANRRLEDIIEFLPDATFIIDRDRKVIAWNRAMEEMTGVPKRAMIGKNHLDAAVPFYGEQRPLLIDLVGSGDRELAAKYDFVKRKGNVLYAETFAPSLYQNRGAYVWGTASLLLDRDGRIVGAIESIRDITEQKRAEEALRASEIKYRTLFEDSKDVVFISSPEGRFLDINPAGLELFGFSDKQKLLQADLGDFYAEAHAREDYLRMMQEKGFVKDYRIELKNRLGVRVSVFESSTVVRDGSGQVIAFRGILRDVSEAEKLQQQLLQLQKMEAIGRLAGGIAHDFNNLLTAIIGNAELMQRMLGNQPAALDRLRSIRETADRAARLTRQLLTMSRKQIVEPRELNLNRIIRGMENILVQLLGEDIRCQYYLDAPTPWVRIDPSQFEQILLNLTVNAREAMAKGGALSISTRNVEVDERDADLHPGVTPGRYVQVSVSDTGEGISIEILPKIFDPFFTTKSKGTGLGLSTVYGIVKQAGGFILVRSEPGRGTTIDVSLPEVSVEKKNAPEKPEFSSMTMPIGRETVLAVEDEPAILQLIIAVLSGLGYSVLSAKDGAEAIPLAEGRAGGIDLLLTDVILPGIRGPQLADELRRKIPDLLVLFMSGYTDERISYAEILEKKAHFLAKPFTPSQLAKKVRAVLDHTDDE